MKKTKTLTTDEYIDGRLETINRAKTYDENTERLSQKEHFRTINVKVLKNIDKTDIPNTIGWKELRKPDKKLVDEIGDIRKCKWILKSESKDKYENIIKEVIEKHAKENDITLVDFSFCDTIYDERQYYECFARGIDNLSLEDTGLKPLKLTEDKKKKLIKKVVDKVNKEWQIKKI